MYTDSKGHVQNGSFPNIDKRATGIKIRRFMDRRGLTVKDVQQYLHLGSVQSIYHWLNGICLPTVDNLYALSQLLRIPMDELLCGNRTMIQPRLESSQMKRLCIYYMRRSELQAV